MSVKLRPILSQDLDQMMRWRWDCREILRTPIMTNDYDQAEWYKKISNRDNPMKFYGIIDNDNFLGYGTLDCQFINGIAELGLLIGPEYRKVGLGLLSVNMLLKEAFNALRMSAVFYECYQNSPAIGFWKNIGKKYNAKEIILPMRKFYNGEHWDSLYGVIFKESL